MGQVGEIIVALTYLRFFNIVPRKSPIQNGKCSMRCNSPLHTRMSTLLQPYNCPLRFRMLISCNCMQRTKENHMPHEEYSMHMLQAEKFKMLTFTVLKLNAYQKISIQWTLMVEAKHERISELLKLTKVHLNHTGYYN